MKPTYEELRDRVEKLEKQIQSVDTYKKSFDDAAVGIAHVSPEGKIQRVNSSFSQMLGYTPKELSKISYEKISHPDDLPNEKVYVEKILNNQIDSFELEKRYIHKHGQIIWAKLFISTVRKPDGSVDYSIANILDIGDQRTIANELEESEAKYGQVFEGAGDAIIVTDKKAKVLDVNPAFTEITGIPTDEMIGKTGFELARKFASIQSIPQLFQMIKNMISGKQAKLTNFKFKNKYLEIISRVPKSGNLAVGIIRDITGRKDAAQKILENESNLKSLIESTGDAIWSVDRNYKILTINTKFQSDFEFVYGKKLEPGVKITDFVSPDEKEKWISRYKKVFRGQAITEQEVYEINGQKKYFEIHLYPITENEKITGATVISSDISSRIESESKIVELNQKFSFAADSAGLGIWELDLKTQELTWDEWMFRLYEVSHDQFSGVYEAWQKSVHPDDLPEAEKKLNEAVKENKKFETEFRIITPAGITKYIKGNATLVKNNEGKPMKMIGVNYEITDRKLAEVSLKNSEERFKTLFDSAPDAYYLNDLKGNFIDGNKKAEDLLGYKKEELIGKDFSKLNILSKREIPKALKNLALNLVGKSTGPEQFQLIKKDGGKLPVEIQTQPVNLGGKKVVLGLARDISLRIEKDKALRVSEERYRNLIETASDSIFVISEEGKFIDVNSTACQALGYQPNELIGKALSEVDPNFDMHGFLEFWDQVNFDQQHIFETTHQRKDGSVFPVEVSGKKSMINNQPFYYGIARDITKRKQDEQALRESKDRFSALVNNLQSGVFYIDTKGNIIEANPALIKILGSPSLEATKSINIFQFQPLIDFGYTAKLKECIASKKIVFGEGEYISKWGKKIYLNYYFVPIYQDKEVIGILGNVEDVTEKKKMETTLRESELFANAVANTTPALIYIYDVEKQQNIYTNEVHKKFFANIDKSSETLSYYDISELAHPDDFQKLIKKSEVMISNPEVERYETEIRMKHKGEWRWMLLTNSVFRKNEKGIGTQVLGAMFDIDDRKRAEQSLKESETRFKALHNASFGGITIHDKGVILDCNKGLSKITGYSFDELIGMDGLQLISAKDRQMVIDKIQADHEKPYEAIGVRKNGEEYPLQLEARMIPYKGKKARVVEFRDITEQKRIEGELKKAKEKAEEISMTLNAALESMSDAVFISDTTGKFINFNEAFATFHKFKSKEQCARTLEEYPAFLDVFYPNGKTLPLDMWGVSKALRGEYGINEEYHIKRNDTGETWIGSYNYAPVLDSSGKIIGSVVTARDITDKKKADLELINAKEKAEESEQKVRSMFENTLTGILFCTPEGKILEANPAILQIVGSPSLEESLKLNLLEHEPLKKIGFSQNILKCLEEQTVITGETKYISKYGKETYLKYFLVPVFSSCKALGVWVNINDMTDLWRTKEDLKLAKEKAEESDRLKSAFLANMSHEIRTPMNGILGFADLLKQPELSGQQKSKYINVIEKSGERMLNIINDLIDISKIEAGQVEYKPDETNLREQAEFLCNFFKPEMAQKGLKFICKIPDRHSIDLIITDREKLYAILTNLLKNALKYTPNGSVEFGYYKHENNVRFYVKDSGIGIPEDRKKAVFERFVQADIEDKKAMEGAGLGLAISKAYAEMMGGELWVDSNELNGSTFFLELPLGDSLTETTTEDLATGAYGNSKSLKDAVILIAEDEETSDLYMTEILKNECREILHVISGKEAVEMVRSNPEISIVLMDIKMPEMSGYEATREIRKFNKQILIIAQTAYALSGDREKALEAGCNDYLPKPVIKASLFDTIKKHYKGKTS